MRVDGGIEIPYELQEQVFGMFAQVDNTMERSRGGPRGRVSVSEASRRASSGRHFS